MKISVVMATYNGVEYIESQIFSILHQIGIGDEVIVVDDCSTDQTLDTISRFNDPRIHVFQNPSNRGVRYSFERAIELASGEILFLADQDDIWKSNKVSNYVDIFAKYPDITLVLSDAQIIDKDGNRIIDSYFARRGGFTAGLLANVIKNRYLGCVMAFRRSILPSILPFPSSIPQHDMWIGVINQVYGSCFYIDMPLLEYRMHDKNTSSAATNKRADLGQMIIWRYGLLRALITRILSIKVRA